MYLGSRILATFVPGYSQGQSDERAYYHHPDRLGTRLITNSNDNTWTEQVTLPFGTLIPNNSPPMNPIFTSYNRSRRTGLDYAMNRFYDGLNGFTQPDPMVAVDPTNPQTANLYAYVTNDPINRIDRAGTLDADSSCTDNEDGLSTCTGGNIPAGQYEVVDSNNQPIAEGATGGPVYSPDTPSAGTPNAPVDTAPNFEQLDPGSTYIQPMSDQEAEHLNDIVTLSLALSASLQTSSLTCQLCQDVGVGVAGPQMYANWNDITSAHEIPFEPFEEYHSNPEQDAEYEENWNRGPMRIDSRAEFMENMQAP